MKNVKIGQNIKLFKIKNKKKLWVKQKETHDQDTVNQHNLTYKWHAFKTISPHITVITEE